MSGPRRTSARLRTAIVLAVAGVLLTAALGTVLVVTGTSVMQDYDDHYADARAANPLSTAEEVPSSPLPSTPSDEQTVREPGMPFEQPKPTAASDGHRYDQWGVRLYDASDTPDDITYPGYLVGEELTNAATWTDMQLRIAACMADEGHDYTFQLSWERSPESQGSGLPASGSDAWIALYGDDLTSTGPYDWTQAGCHGRIVHEMGNDDAN